MELPSLEKMADTTVKKRKMIKTANINIYDSKSFSGWKYLNLHDPYNLHHVSFWRHNIEVKKNGDGQLFFYDTKTKTVYEIGFDEIHNKWYIRDSKINYYYYLDYNPTDIINAIAANTVWGISSIRAKILSETIEKYDAWRYSSYDEQYPCKQMKYIALQCAVSSCSDEFWYTVSEKMGLGKLKLDQINASCEIFHVLDRIDAHVEFDIFIRNDTIYYIKHATHGKFINYQKLWSEITKLMNLISTLYSLTLAPIPKYSNHVEVNILSGQLPENATFLGQTLFKPDDLTTYICQYRYHTHSWFHKWTVETEEAQKGKYRHTK